MKKMQFLNTSFKPFFQVKIGQQAYKNLFGVRTISDTTNGHSNLNKGKSTVNKQEIQKFENTATKWWHIDGEFKPLHSMNKLRVDLVRKGFLNNRQIETIDKEFPLTGLDILDVGCGGGILSQPLARLGANVVGIDAGQRNIKAAIENLPDDLADRVKFFPTNAEEYVADNPDKRFDGVIASEVIEHVENQKAFLQILVECVKPQGSLFITTMNRTTLSWLGGIIAAEYVLGILNRGTHDWNKFISPEEIQSELNKRGCTTRLIHGMHYNVLCNSWSWTESTAINYSLHAVKNT